MGQTEPRLVRWEPAVYNALRDTASATNTSMNLIVNQAVANYLATPQVRAQVYMAKSEDADFALDEAIKKLSGG